MVGAGVLDIYCCSRAKVTAIDQWLEVNPLIDERGNAACRLRWPMGGSQGRALSPRNTAATAEGGGCSSGREPAACIQRLPGSGSAFDPRRADREPLLDAHVDLEVDPRASARQDADGSRCDTRSLESRHGRDGVDATREPDRVVPGPIGGRPPDDATVATEAKEESDRGAVARLAFDADGTRIDEGREPVGAGRWRRGRAGKENEGDETDEEQAATHTSTVARRGETGTRAASRSEGLERDEPAPAPRASCASSRAA